jgi:hypothetical protein
MHTLSKQQVSNWVLLDYSAQKHVYQEKIKYYEKNTTLIVSRLSVALNKQPPKTLRPLI